MVEILSQCPTHYGRKNREGDAVQMLEQKKTTAKIGSKALENDPALIPRGIFVDIDAPEYCEEYDKIVQRAMKESAKSSLSALPNEMNHTCDKP